MLFKLFKKHRVISYSNLTTAEVVKVIKYSRPGSIQSYYATQELIKRNKKGREDAN